MSTLFRTILTKLKYYYRVKRLYQYPFQSPGLSLRFKSLLFVSICTAPTTFTKPVHIYYTYIIIQGKTQRNKSWKALATPLVAAFTIKKEKKKKTLHIGRRHHSHPSLCASSLKKTFQSFHSIKLQNFNFRLFNTFRVRLSYRVEELFIISGVTCSS